MIFVVIVVSINAFMIITLVCIVRFPMFGDETWEKTPQHAVLSLEHHPGVEDHHKGHQDVGHQDQHKDQHEDHHQDHYEDQYAEQHEITLGITMRIIMRISIKINIRISMRISIKINIKISKRITITLGPILESLS